MFGDSLKTTAYHEAGHVCMGVIVGRRVTYACTEEKTTYYDSDFNDEDADEKINLCMIAGCSGEKVANGYYEMGPHNDIDRLSQNLSDAVPDEEEREELIYSLILKAHEILGSPKNRPFLDAMADELLKHKRLNDAQIQEVARRFGYMV